jgi:MoaD family protein
LIRVRLFASLREAAGASLVEGTGRDVAQVLEELSNVYGSRFADIAKVSSFVVNGERATRSTPVADGDELAVLPPVSGGSSAPPAGLR